jgi:hypothetical protein
MNEEIFAPYHNHFSIYIFYFNNDFGGCSLLFTAALNLTRPFLPLCLSICKFGAHKEQQRKLHGENSFSPKLILILREYSWNFLSLANNFTFSFVQFKTAKKYRNNKTSEGSVNNWKEKSFFMFYFAHFILIFSEEATGLSWTFFSPTAALFHLMLSPP